MTGFAPHPDIGSLALLASVAERGSLGKAAAAHGISQPSASARIDALERRLGVQLLVRRSTGSGLTAAGELVVGWAEPVLLAMEELSRGAEALRRKRSAELAVAASLSIAEYVLPEWLARLHAEHPGLAVNLRVANSTDVIAAVQAGSVPVGFVEGPSIPKALARIEVGTDRLLVVVSPSHPWARRRSPLSMAEFCATPLLLREPGSGTRQVLERAVGGAANLAPPALQLSTTTAIRTAAAAGAAPAVLSELTVRGDLAAGRLVAVTVVGLVLRRRLRAVWLRGTRPDGAAAALIQLARADR
ncbi:MAG: LysR family transcriptional regulator [Actinobacteria bacterium 69-20]|jgi:DNA-binding transcriptional LysR family regulator|nr:LysR family transcriptional regulator [Actinomycetota bacterium]OJV25410.1 MAG: LysR family transcriptional regulator [Actinobacteria bacterium 69-20]